MSNQLFPRQMQCNAVAIAAALLVASSAVFAQSNTTGNIFGTVEAPSGASVVIENVSTGLKRTLPLDVNGRFIATSLPLGQYRVMLVRAGTVVGAQNGVTVSIGRGSEVVFSSEQRLQRVEVTGTSRTIDVSNSNNGASFTSKQLDSLPMGRNVESIIQLAPNTTRADSRFAGGASFGGGAASENSYYINGFPVVNPLTGLGASQLPFGAIAEAQVLTGGFGAEFGRSVGGVVNVTTKSGGNTWEAGANYSISPGQFRDAPIDFYYSKTGAPSNAGTDGKLRLRRSENTRVERSIGGYVGGPLIKDKLFLFVAAEKRETTTGGLSSVTGSTASTTAGTNGWLDQKNTIDRFFGKIDWNLTSDHRLEFTLIGDTPELHTKSSGYNYTTHARNGVLASDTRLVNVDDNGANVSMFKYTGNVTSDLTVTALMGRSVAKHENIFANYDPEADLFSTSSSVDVRNPAFAYANPQVQTGNVLAPGSKDIVKSYRFDLEYQLGRHLVRGGLDRNQVQSVNAGEIKAGGGTWTYYKTDTPDKLIDVGGAEVIVGNNGYYVSKDIFKTVTDSYGEQSAWYIEDKFQVSKNVLLVAGLRNESFKNKNGDKQTFLEMKNQWNPRLSAAWDVNGDASLKLFGSAGRYSVPIPTHITVRGAGKSTFTSEYFTYTGVDANGAPTGLGKLTKPLSGNNEYGQEKDLKSLAALDMKPSYQDEISLGFEKAVNNAFNVGGRFTFRSMGSTIDDFCDVRPFEKWATAHKVKITNPLWGNTCQTFNPGKDNTFLVDFAGTGKDHSVVALTAAEQGFEKVKRTYTAIDLFVEHPNRNGWYGKVNYTWSKNKGNTEGQVRSDNGQADVAVTSVWDYPELMVGAYGYLPNDRRHQIKAYGYIDLSAQWALGANLLLASGRPRSCIGSAANPGDSPNYANQTFYCFGSDRSKNVLVSRGTVGNLPFDSKLDLSLTFKPAVVNGLALRLDVFNVLNRQIVQNVEERYNNGTRVRNTYELPLSTTAPRSFRFMASYDRAF